MITVTIDEQEFKIKHSPKEFTIGEYEKMIEIINNKDFDSFDKYFNLFVYLGIPEKLLNQFDINNFSKLIKEYNVNIESLEFTPSFKVDGIKFSSDKETFSLNVKQMRKCIEYINKDKNGIAEILAILVKEEGKEDHLSDNSIRYKANLFRDKVTADIALPFFTSLIEKIINK